MHTSLLSLTLTIMVVWTGLAEFASADPPEKPRLMQYSRLWMHSQFTIKPVRKPTVVESPLERDWMLGSIRPSGDGWAVTLINKKDRKERIRFLPGYPSGDFQLLKVQQDTKNNENSRVQIRKGSQTAWISYDEKLVKVRPMTTSKTASKRPPQTNGKSSARPPIPGRSSSSSTNKPRVRAVPRRGR